MTRFWNKLQITQKFIGYLLFFTFIPLVITGYASYITSSRILKDEASLFAQTVVTNQIDYLDLQLSLVENLMLNLSGVEEIRDVLEADNADIDTFTSLSTQARIGYILNGYINLGGLVSIDIFTARGTRYHVGDTLNTDNYRQELIDELFADAIASGQGVTWVGIGDNVNTNSTYKKVITATRALYRIDPQTLEQIPIALLIVNYSPDFLYDHFNNVNLGTDAYIIVTDTSDQIIYYPDRQQIGEPLDAGLVAAVGNAEEQSFITDVDTRATSISVARSDFNGFSVIGVVPLNTLVTQSSVIGIATLLVLILSAIIALIAAYYFNENVVVPIRHVTEHFEQFGDGNINTAVTLQAKSDDEIGDLVRWFNVFIHQQMARQKAEQELQVAKEAAEAANRSKSIFLTNISHELRTPLNVMLGFAQLIQEDSSLSLTTRQRVNTILQSGNHLLELINDVLDMSRIESGKVELNPVAFELHNTLMGIQDMLSVKAEAKNLELRFFHSHDLPRVVETDVKKLRQVIINLVSNAIKFTDRGHVHVHVSLDKRDEQSYLEFTIEDTGIGIRPEEQKQIFEVFSRAQNNTQEGTGLGLPISRYFVRMMGGDISVDSSEGQGSRFHFFVKINIVAKEGHTAYDRQQDTFSWHLAEHNFSVVVAEDHKDSQDLMVTLLEARGFNVLLAENGAEAVDIVELHRPRIVFMDIQMPVMDGYEAIQKIREFDTESIIIAVTAGAFNHESQNLLDIGSNAIIHKPFEHAHFYHLLGQFVSQLQLETTDKQVVSLPDELQDRLQRAIREINVEEVNHLIQLVEDHDPHMAANIESHVKNYRFDLLNTMFSDRG